MATIQIQCNATQATSVVEVFQRGHNGQPDTLVRSGLLTPGGAEVDMAEGCYVVVRAATDDQAKSIDNW